MHVLSLSLDDLWIKRSEDLVSFRIPSVRHMSVRPYENPSHCHPLLLQHLASVNSNCSSGFDYRFLIFCMVFAWLTVLVCVPLQGKLFHYLL